MMLLLNFYILFLNHQFEDDTDTQISDCDDDSQVCIISLSIFQLRQKCSFNYFQNSVLLIMLYCLQLDVPTHLPSQDLNNKILSESSSETEVSTKIFTVTVKSPRDMEICSKYIKFEREKIIIVDRKMLEIESFCNIESPWIYKLNNT